MKLHEYFGAWVQGMGFVNVSMFLLFVNVCDDDVFFFWIGRIPSEDDVFHFWSRRVVCSTFD